MEYVFDQDRIKKYIMDTQHPGKLSYKYIKGIKVDYATETGSLQHRLHMHALVSVTHKTKVKLDIPKIRSLFNKVLDTNIHLDVKVSGGGVRSIEDYITK